MLIALFVLAGLTGVWAKPATRRPAGLPYRDSGAGTAGPSLRRDGPAQKPCVGDKHRSVLRAKLRVVDGRLSVDKKASEGGFQPSELFGCRASLTGNEGKKQRFERRLLDGLDKALRSLPRFHLPTLFNDEQERLLTSLPTAERTELIQLMGLNTETARAIRLKKTYFLYLPQDLQLSVVDELDLAQKKEFFAYLPEEERAEVLRGASEPERAQLLAKKKEEPPLDKPPANEPLRKVVSEFPSANAKTAGTWADFLAAYNAWNATRAEEPRRAGSPEVALKEYLSNFLKGGRLLNTAVHAFDPAEGDSAAAATGQLALRVADPIGDVNDPADYKVIVPDSIGEVPGAEFITPSRETIVKRLSSLQGDLWECRRVEAFVNDYFTRSRSGYQRVREATNALTVCDQELSREPKLIKIQPVPYVARVIFLGTVEEKDVRAALRELLTDEELKTYRDNPALLTNCEEKRPTKPAAAAGGAQPSATPEGTAVEMKCVQIKFEALAGGADKLPYLNLGNWAVEKAGLASKGFLAVLDEYEPPAPARPSGGDDSDGEGETPDEDADEDSDNDDEDEEQIKPLYVTVMIMKDDSGNDSLIKNAAAENDEKGGTQAGGGPPAPAPSPQPSADGAQDTGAAGPTNGSAGASGVTPAPVNTPEPVKPPEVLKPRRNFIGGEVVYRPGQGVRTYAVYKRIRPGEDEFALRFGGDGGVLVTGEYAGDDLFRGRFARSVPFRIEGYTDSIAKRILNGVQLDERRTGGAFRLLTDWKRNPTGLKFSFEARRETVWLERPDVETQKQNLTTLSFGSVYAKGTPGVKRVTWQVEPNLRVGLGLDGQPGFAVLRANGTLHFHLLEDRNVIFAGRGEAASRRTPLFEQPSFGAEETVRGFRADDAIGLRQWAFKTEYQSPLPGTSPDSKGLAKLIREYVKYAAFLDVGGIYRTTGSSPGVRWGPGAGLTFKYGEADLKLYWAYGLGDAAAGRGRGRFYFSVSQELPQLIRFR